MEIGRTFKSLEVPPNYFGCHIHLALVSILMPVSTLLGFLFLPWMAASLIVLSALACSGALFGIGAWLGTKDPFWVEGGQRHLLDETDYLDV
jgi:hypothetical protein